MFVNENTKNRVKVYEQKNAIEKDFSLGHYYISEVKFKEMQNYLVVGGDIIVSCAGTIGEIYELPNEAEKGIINQALMRIKLFYSAIKQYFILYFDIVLKNESNEKGKGTGMKNIPPFAVLKNMLMPIPPENEATRILSKIQHYKKILENIDEEYANTAIIKQQIKNKILNSIFSDNSSYKSYYEKYDYIKNFISLISTVGKEVKIKDCLKSGEYPVIAQGQELINGYSNDNSKVITNLPVIIFGDHTRIVKYIDFPFIAGADGTKLIFSKDLLPKYIYYCFLYASNNIENRGYARHFAKVKDIKIPIMNLDNQKKIIRLLDNAFNMINII